MGSKIDEHEYRIKELERKVAGLQRTVSISDARHNHQQKLQDKRIRDLEIRTAVQSGTPQKEVAKIFDLSRGRVSQIVRQVG